MSFLCAVLIALAQSQPDNPHDVNNKDRAVGDTSNAQVQSANTGNSNSVQNKDQMHPATQPDLDKAEKDNPHHRMAKDKMSSMNDVLMQLHAANLEEIDAGQAAQQNGGSRVQEFGRMLVEDHQSADRQVQDLASKRGVKLDDSMGRMKIKDAHARLDGKTGADFDKTFASAMIDGHQKVIEMVKSARSSCKDTEVCNLLDQLLPTLQHHLKAAEDLRQPAAQGRRP